MNVNDLVEVQIICEDYYEQNKRITKLWDVILKDDDEFHFLYEPGYLLIRFDTKHADIYKLAIKRRRWKCKYFPEWKETNSEAVNHYKSFFAQYLHLISVLVLENHHDLGFIIDEDEFSAYSILERIAHCFYDVGGRRNFRLNEEITFAMMVIDRARTSGYLDAKKEFEEKNDEVQ